MSELPTVPGSSRARILELEAEVERLRAELAKLREEREDARWHAMGEDL